MVVECSVIAREASVEVDVGWFVVASVEVVVELFVVASEAPVEVVDVKDDALVGGNYLR